VLITWLIVLAAEWLSTVTRRHFRWSGVVF
jgi:hypothetical protein